MLEIFLTILYIVMLLITALFFLIGIYDFAVGPSGTKSLLKKLHFPFSYTILILLECIFAILTAILYKYIITLW